MAGFPASPQPLRNLLAMGCLVIDDSEVEPFGSESGVDALAPREVETLLETVRVLEHEVLLRLAISTGMRRGDIVRVEWPNVDLDTGWVRYWEEKKDRTWKAPIGGSTLQRLRQYADVRDAGSKWVFPSDQSETGHVSSRTAYNWFHRWLNEAGLGERPFHALRATCIKLAQHRGWEPYEVCRLTGDKWETIQRHYMTPADSEMEALVDEKPII